MPFLEQASSVSQSVDSVFLFIFAVSVAFLLAITFAIVYFVIRYSRSRNPEPVDIEGNFWLELVWTVVPLGLFLVMFTFGWTNYRQLKDPPRDSMVVEVTGKQWAWSFKYPSGRQTSELYVALGRPVRLELKSSDVIHGFFIPAFRLKLDVVPGATGSLWFTPLLLGSFDIQCSVICGVNHSYMLSKVHVMPEADFKTWYFSRDDAMRHKDPVPAASPSASPGPRPTVAPDEPPALAMLKRHDCLECHSVDGKTGVGPTFKGLFGSVQEFVVGEATTKTLVDETVLIQGITDPGVRLMKGYPPVMPKRELSRQELVAIVTYLESLGTVPKR
ncbi:MAG: cytochrome c oxidase subunit II [Candidatus Riflebacteria bacterium]|nr:cytochrome c oxidase subunit II [Candidatus Riflebacteria bacterium]